MTTVNSVSEMSSGMRISVGMEVEDANVRFFVGAINDSHNLCSIDKTKTWTVKTTTDPMRKCMEQGNYAVNAALLRVVPDNAKVSGPSRSTALLNDLNGEKNMEWIPTADRMPISSTPVLADTGRKHPIRACWIQKFSEEVPCNWDGDADYNEKEDQYYWPEGWYEWNRHEETHWRVDETVTHWMPLPLPFNAEASGPSTRPPG